MSKIKFDPENPDIEIVRKVVMERLRNEGNWSQLGTSVRDFEPYIEYTGPPHLGISKLDKLALEVMWQLVNEGIIVPGQDWYTPNFPHFNRTIYGEMVLETEPPSPYDPTGYLEQLTSKITVADSTVLAYLNEGLTTFRRGNLIASTVMLGIASERVFLLLCESMVEALKDSKEKDRFEGILKRFPMKPKQDWMHSKIMSIEDSKPAGFPENATLMITAIYNYIRLQRNDLGHPRENPPNVKREEAYAFFQIFPSYYETAEAVRHYLSSNKV